MKTLIICCVLFVGAYGAPMFNKEFNNEWALFKRVHSKHYKSIGEEVSRPAIWEINLAKTQRHKLEAASGINRFGDMTRSQSTNNSNYDTILPSTTLVLPQAVENNMGESTNSSCSVNAWIFLNEDEPLNTNYKSPNSCYQTLIQNNIYQSVNILYICFVITTVTSPDTTPAGNGSSYTIEMGSASHPSGLTNQNYMNYVISDARKNNPNIKIAVTLNWGDGSLISNIFSISKYSPQENAENFAANLMVYLKEYDLDGFDIDWESPISKSTTKEQFAYLINAIGATFKQQQNKHYYLTLSPDKVDNLDATAVNNNIDFVNLQLYSGSTYPDDFKNVGVNPNLFAYGAKFEDKHQTAIEAYKDNKDNYHYKIFTSWRLNSIVYMFEQTQQQHLFRLCNDFYL